MFSNLRSNSLQSLANYSRPADFLRKNVASTVYIRVCSFSTQIQLKEPKQRWIYIKCLNYNKHIITESDVNKTQYQHKYKIISPSRQHKYNSDQQRICTDVLCTVIGLTFTATLLITSMFLFNRDHATKASFPSDSAGRVCGHDLTSHPYVYFTNFPSIVLSLQCRNRGFAFTNCPTDNLTRLNCVPTEDIGCSFNSNPLFYVGYYANTQESTQSGSFCAPIDENLKNELYESIGIINKENFFKDVNTIIVCGFISLGISLFFVVLVQFFPQIMNTASIVLGLCTMLALIVFVGVFPSGNVLQRLIFGVVLLLLLATTAYGCYKMRRSFGFYDIFLQYSTKMVGQNWLLLTYIPIFFTALVLFVLIMMLQIQALWSSAPLRFNPSELYYSLSPGTTSAWTAVGAIQLIWGLSFIKESFNYCISANAVRWYFEKEEKEARNGMRQHTVFTPLKFLITKNFGSVAAGSFMNGFFSLFDLIFDLLRPDSNSNFECYRQLYSCAFSKIGDFFNLVRADAFAYIALSGNPYCNASRYCELIYSEAIWFEDSQSISRSYRICSHLLLAGIVGLANFMLQGQNASLFVVLVVFILSLFISTLWISLHADATDAIQVTFLLQQKFTNVRQANFFESMKLKRSLVKQVEQHFKSLNDRIQR